MQPALRSPVLRCYPSLFAFSGTNKGVGIDKGHKRGQATLIWPCLEKPPDPFSRDVYPRRSNRL